MNSTRQQFGLEPNMFLAANIGFPTLLFYCINPVVFYCYWFRGLITVAIMLAAHLFFLSVRADIALNTLLLPAAPSDKNQRWNLLTYIWFNNWNQNTRGPSLQGSAPSAFGLILLTFIIFFQVSFIYSTKSWCFISHLSASSGLSFKTWTWWMRLWLGGGWFGSLQTSGSLTQPEPGALNITNVFFFIRLFYGGSETKISL